MRIWIIGNGPSLGWTPLEKFKGEMTFALNRIHLLYPRTTWRPTYYLKIDYNPYHVAFWKDEVTVHRELGIPHYLWSQFKDGYPSDHASHELMPDGVGDDPNTVWIDRCERHHYYAGDNIHKRPQSWHLPELCTWGTGINTMMQLAVLMGYDEIYLLGCDLGYGPDYTKNFFDSKYNYDLRDRSQEDNILLAEMHKVARRSCPIPIYNATLGGELEIYPRVDLGEVLVSPSDFPEELPLWQPNERSSS